MRPSLRFLALTIIGWAGIRAATLGALPGAELFRIDRSEAKAPPIMPTQFPPIQPVEPTAAGPLPAGYAPLQYAYPSGAVSVPIRPVIMPIYYGASAPTGSSPLPAVSYTLPQPGPQFYAPVPPLSQWPLASIAAGSIPPRSSVVVPGQSTPAALVRNGIDRLQLTAWALLRPQEAGVAAPPSLGTGGTLGGSQAGARLAYNFTRQIAASLRTTTEAGGRGGEIAGGMRVQPMGGVPIWFTAERRQRIGDYGRNAFALFFEGGVYDRPMPWQFSLDSYLEGGVVGFNNRDGFIDGALTLTRPIYKQFSAGFGVWGGAQPGIYRVDAGPRISMRVRNNVRVHFDWRQRLVGKAAPGSGPAITLAGDF